MEKQQHTPGPWKIDDAFKTSTVITDDTDMVICQIHGLGPGANADGRLITAAPDLLEACLAMIEGDGREKDHSVDFYARLELCNIAFDKARAAIAKATGI